MSPQGAPQQVQEGGGCGRAPRANLHRGAAAPLSRRSSAARRIERARRLAARRKAGESASA
eukprot:CAMPEP_0181173538 /NCGR_PEP_ID=MMETSP1096-20121128/3054_1 /TAXON_ID=156174 ORGANISM="Chrysochromulina ericina, Strain CCMP281" /NCGR_SAMPLE_ID=MMETSP1096 /ASSEMBLY_ACC=CAM_ASM_000453 /LENGTH=60 /DNA_ID=CAMNT_0023261375 /DNA_START=635 /DNA_END=814 /DNA_ORIENTATION=-